MEPLQPPGTDRQAITLRFAARGSGATFHFTASAGNAATDQAFRTSKTTASDGVSYGSNLELKNITASNISGAMIYTNYTSNKLYTDYTMTGVAGGLYAFGTKTATSSNPSSFVEMTWSGEGRDTYGF